MKAVIEFTGYFRLKVGAGFLEIDVEGAGTSVLDLIMRAEEVLSEKNFKVLNGRKLKDGVLVFFRNENGGLERIFDLSLPLFEAESHIIMANLMGGG